MKNVHVNTVVNSTSHRPGATLDAVLTKAQVARFHAYVRWARGGQNPGVDKTSVSFPTAAQNAKFTVNGDSIVVELLPGSAYPDVAKFIDDALEFATAEE